MRGCDGKEAYIEKYLWGEATAEEVSGFENHAAGCPSCKEAFAGAVAFDAAMKSALPAMAAGVSNPREAILGKITVGDLMAPRPTSWKTIRWRAVRWVLLCGLIATIVVAFEGFATVAIARKKVLRNLAAAEVKSLGRFIERYGELESEFPATGNEEMLVALVKRWGKPHASESTFPFERDRVVGERALDPWGEPYIYRSAGDSFILYSVGENGRDDRGRGDDVPYSASRKERSG